jgi:hypothetical protein
MKTFITSILATFALTLTAHADCVSSARSYMSFRVISSDTLVLTNGPGPDIQVQVWGAFLTSTSRVRVIRDSFCSFDKAVLLIDGHIIDVREVKEITR